MSAARLFRILDSLCLLLDFLQQRTTALLAPTLGFAHVVVCGHHLLELRSHLRKAALVAVQLLSVVFQHVVIGFYAVLCGDGLLGDVRQRVIISIFANFALCVLLVEPFLLGSEVSEFRLLVCNLLDRLGILYLQLQYYLLSCFHLFIGLRIDRLHRLSCNLLRL